LPSVIWSERGLILKYILVSLASIASGLVTGYGIRLVYGSLIPPYVVAIFSVAIVLMVIVGLRNTSANELLVIAKGVLGRHT
jgi:hypothetical protein